MARVWNWRDFSWKGHALYRTGIPAPVISIEADYSHLGMWRVRQPDGMLSDMVNKSRAMDAAEIIALAISNMHDSPLEASPARQKLSRVSEIGPEGLKRAA